MPVLIATSGWQYRDRKPLLHPDVPQRCWLERHAEAFATVEVNNAFYRLPDRTVFAGWAARTPADYVITIKASRFLSHIKRRTTDWGYLRLHAGREGWDYGPPGVAPWAARLVETWSATEDVFAYTNNDPTGAALRDAAFLADAVHVLGRTSTCVPPLLR